MKRRTLFCILLALCSVMTLSAQKYQYETVEGDPYGTKIYTLKNGLKVYMSVYKDVPRIQTYIAVRAGSKNDPAETTGLAHYLEHLMFKGTDKVGTANWQEEKPLLDQIEKQFEIYRAETDPEKRAAIYHVIDSLSYLASGLAIPNEYVKLMKFIGSTGTNAWTSNDNTVYIEDIPANQLANWVMIESDRFKNPVIRLFHTELETVYEEKNRSLTSDSRKASEAMLSALYPQYPYGTQTTLGEPEHLKNPSITNIKHFVSTYYVPNNMAIVLAGDFNPDEAVALIEKYFGDMEAKRFPKLKDPVESETKPMKQNVEVTVVGQEAEFVNIAFRIGKPANAKEIYLLKMLDYVMSNGKCGLIDVNINQKQLTASATSFPYVLCDNSSFVLNGKPKKGQTLEEVRDLLLEQLQIVCKGEFSDELMTGAINNMRLQEMQQLESNSSRANKLMSAFTNAIPWAEACRSVDMYAQITKEDLVKFANEYFNGTGYVTIYKKQGKPEEVHPVAKPAITPIQVNRDAESDFFKSLKEIKTTPIEPVFVNYKKAIQTGELDKKIESPIYCVKNTENQYFSLQIVFQEGELTNRELPIVSSCIKYLGTNEMTPEQVQMEFYKMACNFGLSCGDEECTLYINGLSENFEPALALALQVFSSGKMDADVFKEVIANRIKSMEDAKKSQDKVLAALRIYGEYGPELVNFSLKPSEMQAMDASIVSEKMQHLLKCAPEFRYYGPLSVKQVNKVLAAHYTVPASDEATIVSSDFENRPVTEDQVLFVPYDAKQARLVTYSRGPQYDRAMLPIVTMYNSYFGGGMNAIVFQEMREKRSLAYTAQSSYVISSKPMDYTYNYSFIGTQNDKVVDAWTAFNELFNDMPQSETAFALAKQNAKSNIATSRKTKLRIIASYVTNKRFGYSYERQKDIYEALDGFTLQDVVEFNNHYIKNQPKVYMLLGREKDIDLQEIEKKFGPVKKLSLEDIFGY